MKVSFKAPLVWATVLLVILFLLPAGGSAQADETVKFTILHTNDEHSDLIPYGPAVDHPQHQTQGGFTRIAYLIKKIKAEKGAVGEPVLTLSAGDFSQGTLFAWLETSLAAELSLMQAAGYDAVALGNHEFDLGPAYRAMALNAAKAKGVKLPILCANIDFSETDPADDALAALWSDEDKAGAELALQPYTIKTLSNGLKVGIFGLLGVEAEAVAPTAQPLSFGNVVGKPTDPVSFVNRVLVAQRMVRTLKEKGCQVIVALTHMGTREERELAKFVEGIHVIVGGHSHDLNYPPITVKHPTTGWETLVVQAGAYTSHLGKLELEYRKGRVHLRSAEAIPIDHNVPTDSATDQVIQGYLAALKAALGVDVLLPYAETDHSGDGGFHLNRYPPMVETNLGDLIADAYLATSRALEPSSPAHMAFEANGVIRASIPPGATGRFSFYDLYRTLPLGGSPFDPTKLGYPLVAFHLRGAEIKGILEAILDMDNNTFFVQVSGCRVRYRPAGPRNSKLVSLETGDPSSGWSPVKPDALYKVVTNFYTASFLALFGVKPRDASGNEISVGAARLDRDPANPGIQEIKGWEALAVYLRNLPDTDGDGLPNVPASYRFPQRRIAAERWYLAEGATEGGMETFVLVQNPGESPVKVNIRFHTEKGEVRPPELQGITIPARSRRTFKVNDFVTTYHVSTLVEALDGEVVVERAMYGNERTWGHASVGSFLPKPSGIWYFAEGCTDGGMETWLLLQNPHSTPVKVNVELFTGKGPVEVAKLKGVELPPLSRTTVPLHQYVVDYHVSVRVVALTGTIICERAMYGPGRTWATESVGVDGAAPGWYLAEGATEGGMETFVLVQNPGESPVKVNIRFHTEKGEVRPPELQEITIPARSRRTFKVNDFVTTYHVSTLVEALDGEVVVERAMYGNERTWGHASVGVPSTARSWYLAEGATEGGMETFVLVQNPGESPVKVNIRFHTEKGEVRPPELQEITIPARSRRTFKVNDFVTTYHVSTLVEALDGEVVVERAMYGNERTWGHASVAYDPSLAW